MNNLLELSAMQLAALYRSGDASPVDAIRQVIDAADASTLKVNAFCWIDREAAFVQARASEARWRAAAPLSPLDGVPVSIKDNIGVHGMPTRFGSRAVSLRNSYAPDSPASMRLREAGAVLFGKTTMPDFAHKILSDSPLTGLTRNPWNLGHTAGGSSSGAAAAVACGIGPIAVGTDGGGSIRIPAAFTGTFGFKPSFGRVPHYPRGPFALLSHVGPITRSVADAALAMNALAQPDSRDWYALPFTAVDYTELLRRRLTKVRVAWSDNLGLPVKVDDEVMSVVQRAAQILQDLGASVERADPPSIQRCNEIHQVLWTTFSAKLVDSMRNEEREQLDPSLLALADMGRRQSCETLLNALFARGEAGKEVSQFFDTHDLLLCPVHPTVAPALDDLQADAPPAPVFTPWCNQLGLPSAAIPCGMSRSGLPLAVQIVGARFADAAVLSAASAFEVKAGAAQRAPIG